MTNRIYLGEFGDNHFNNPLEDTNYLNILGLLPTLGNEIKKRVLDLLNQRYKILQKESLNPNLLSNDEVLKKAKSEIINVLNELENLTGKSNIINIYGDDCFTNKLLLNLISKILGEKNFERFVSIKNIDLSKSYNSDDFSIHTNSLMIIGGSLNDTYTIDESYYTGDFAEMVKMLGDDFDLAGFNSRIIGVCFGQQYLANLLGIMNTHSSSIIATYRGLAQFGPSNCSLQNYNFVSRVYQEALFGLSNFGLNNQFSTFFTRTGYVDFDLLKTGYNNLVVPLIKDEITESIVGWGTKNGNILGVQFHPEISFFDDRKFLMDNIQDIIPYLTQYKNYDKLVENFNFDTGFGNIIKNDIGEHFYTFAILTFLKSIKNRFKSTHKTDLYSYRPYKDIDNYQKTLNELTKIVREKMDTILAISNPSLDNKKERLTFLKKIDEAGRLLLNSKLDWKVNRGLDEVSKVLGFNDLGILLEGQLDFLKMNFPGKKLYFFRDWGAGDGSLLKDLYSRYKGKDILFYGVGDYIYFDIFPSLKSKGIEMGIPEDVIILLFEEFLKNYLKFEDGNILTKVKTALNKTKLEHIQKIHRSSITGDNTVMFSGEGEYDVGEESIKYISENNIIIEELKKYIINNFYSLFEGYFERIYVSKFNDFNLETSLNISKVDFQVSIRSTSHVDDKEYMKIINDYISKSANPGSIYIDNGVHRSYTRVPRIYELFDVSKITIDTKFSLIYDENTNYFTGVIIEKYPYHENEFFTKELKPGYKVVSLKEACNSTFFKLEYFIRNFIVRNFKNYNVFWDFDKEIIETLVEIMSLLKVNNTSEIKYIILKLINYIATNYKNDNIVYDLIDLNILEKYSIGGESLEQIISSSIYIPNWINLDAKRK